MLELINVKKVYTTKAGETSALNDVSLVFPKKGLVFITGKSGSGKTTLLNVIGGLDGFDGGEIIIQGKKFSEFSPEEYNSYRNTFVGFIFQGYNLLPEYTVEKNIRLANELQGKESNINEINALLESVDLAGLNHRLPSELSGGQKQRVAIARALIKNPKIIIADEPTGALDSATGIQVLETLKKLSNHRLVIIVSHDLELAEKYADRIINLVDGDIIDDVTLVDTAIDGNVAENGKDFIVKSGSQLSKEENESLLNAIKQEKNVVVSKDITIRKKSKTVVQLDEKPAGEVKLLSSKMKLKSSIGLGLKSLKVKPLRLAFTIFLSVIAFSVFGLFDTIAAYSNAKVIANLLSAGDYSSIQLNAEHVGDTRKTKLTFSNEDIQSIKQESGYDFRPVYDINDKKYEGINNVVVFSNITAQTKIGEDYYPRGLDGFIEFSKEEITATTIDKGGFNYKIISGKYPEIRYTDEGEYDEDSLKEIAVSTLVADAIIHYLAGSTLEGKTLKTYDDFTSQEIFVTLNGSRYKIVGIIDCGKIPEKYEILQKVAPSQTTAVLADDYKAYINSACYLMAFVPEGFVNIHLQKNNRIANYYTNEYMYQIRDDRNFILASISALEDTRFYKASDIPNEKVFLFNQQLYDSNDNRITIQNKNQLKDNELLVSLTNFSKMFRDELNTLFGKSKENETAFKAAYTIANDKTKTYEEREEAIQAISDVFKKAGIAINKKINFRRELKGTGTLTTYEIYVVGVYVDVNIDIGPSTENWHPLAFSNDGLTKVGVYNKQGFYSRLVTPLYATGFSCNSNNGAEFIAANISNSKGFRLQFYNNALYETIDTNGELITQFTLVALAAAMVLALFSIFMLFNYISTSIVSKRQSIGILRALGSKGKDVLTMFITESLVIALINGVIASGVAFLGCLLVNYYIKTGMNITIDFAIFGIRQVVFIMLASILAGALSSILPITKICKEKPVDLIRKP